MTSLIAPTQPRSAPRSCQGGCSLSTQILCWRAREQELRHDPELSRDEPDEEIVAADLAAVGHEIDALLRHAASTAKVRRILGEVL